MEGGGKGEMVNSYLLYLDQAVARYPDSIAVDDTEKSYTYAQLRHQAHLWAAALTEKKLCRRTPVAVLLPRSADSIVAFMAVLYTGNFYAILDSTMPQNRLAAIFDSLGPVLVLTVRAYENVCTAIGVKSECLIFLDEIEDKEVPPTETYMRTVDTDPMYLIFTSGSTGTPKGVVVPHKAVIGYVDWALEECGFSHEDHIGHVLPFHYVAADKSMYSALAAGSWLTVVPKEVYQSPKQLMDFLKRRCITSLDWVPSGLGMIADMKLLDDTKGLTLRRVLFAGEAMPTRTINIWRKALPGADFWQIYGASECRAVMHYRIERIFEENESVPLGHHRPNTGILLIDDEGRIIEDKQIVGELYLYGSALALGYWKDTKKTAEAFVQNPMHNDYLDRMFRTGDLAMYNDRGELVFCGRADSRIKQLGHRIELREIELAAARIEGFRRVCVLYREEVKQIALFYEADEFPKPGEIRAQLRKWLPKHMLPIRYIGYKNFPQLDSGKIDRQKLKEALYQDVV